MESAATRVSSEGVNRPESRPEAMNEKLEGADAKDVVPTRFQFDHGTGG